MHDDRTITRPTRRGSEFSVQGATVWHRVNLERWAVNRETLCMAGISAVRTRPSLGGFDPFRVLFGLLTSIRFALMQLGVVALAAMLGVIFPQAPDPIRLNPSAFDLWIEQKRAMYGPFTDAMRTMRLFEVYRSPWFTVLLGLLLVSVAVCTANRFAPIWRSVRHPVRRVNDRYFETARNRAVVATPADPTVVEQVLRRARFRVETVAERDGTRYLFADKHAWAQLATFASHLSLILFIAGGLVSKLVGFQTFIEIGEGSSQPVFPVIHANQMQVLNLDSIEGKDNQGRITDYRTMLVVNQAGKELCRGYTTVNNPLRCNGYTFHQYTYTDLGMALQIKDARSGQVVYAETPILKGTPGTPNPRLRVRDANGAVVMDELVTMAPVSQQTLAQIFTLPDTGKLFALSGPLGLSNDWRLSIFHAARRGDPNDRDLRMSLKPQEEVTADGYTFEFVELRTNPYDVLQGLPGMERAVLVQMAQGLDGAVYLDLQNMGDRSAANARTQLEVGVPQQIGDYEYTFSGRREFTGVLVKRDPGSWFIWTATALLMIGLLVTFYVPRRRLWVQVTPERTTLAGLGDRSAQLDDDLTRLTAQIGQAEAPRPAQRSLNDTTSPDKS